MDADLSAAAEDPAPDLAPPASPASPAAPPQSPAPTKGPGFPWPTLALLGLALVLIWQTQPGVPSEAPLGAAPPALAGVVHQVVPPQASPAPLDSGALSFARLRGRVVLLEFYATWCGPCVASLGELSARERPPGLEIVAVTTPDDMQTPAQIETFAREQAFPSLVTDGRSHAAYGVHQIPYALVIDRAGRVAWKGSPHDAACRAAIDAALLGSDSDPR